MLVRHKNPDEKRKSRLDLVRERIGQGSEAAIDQQPTESDVSSTPQEEKREPSQPGKQYITDQEKYQYMSFENIGQPLSHDRRHGLKYSDRRHKLNMNIDSRLWPYWNHLLKNAPGISQTDRMDRIILAVLLSKGYPVDPTILDRPFRIEDVPKPPDA